MSDAPKQVKIGPKATTPAGSFMSRDKILGDIDEAKLRSLESSQVDAKEAKATAEEQKRIDEIDALLPKDVPSSIGEVSYAFFKQRFQTVWDQVAEKTHLTSGYCTYTWEVAPGVNVTIRTMKSGEMKFLRLFTPTTDPVEDAAKYLKEDSLFRTVRFVMGVTMFDGSDLPTIPTPRPRVVEDDTTAKWLTAPAVAQRFDWADDLAEELTDKIAGVFVDLSTAYRFALQENVKNQFAPPSLT